MYAKLDKLRDDLKKARAKRDAADAKVKQFFEKGAKSAMENKTQLMKFLQ